MEAMNSHLQTILRDANGRYLNADERSAWLAYAQSVPNRFETALAVERAEDGALRQVIEEMKRRYPNFANYHDQGWARCFRDLQLVLRQDVQSMLLDDVHLLDDKILFWLRTIFASYNLTPAFCHDAFSLLHDALKEHLGLDDFGRIQPYLQRNVEVLSDFPEPVTPAV
jgi:hypothetical protein